MEEGSGNCGQQIVVAAGMCMAPIRFELLNNYSYSHVHGHVIWQVLGMGWPGCARTEECGVFGSSDFCKVTWL